MAMEGWPVPEIEVGGGGWKVEVVAAGWGMDFEEYATAGGGRRLGGVGFAKNRGGVDTIGAASEDNSFLGLKIVLAHSETSFGYTCAVFCLN